MALNLAAQPRTLIKITESINKTIEQKKFGCEVFIDLKKVFDTINQHNLLKKLNKMVSEIMYLYGSGLISLRENNIPEWVRFISEVSFVEFPRGLS